ncbi:hypothetical protein [Sporohalobacter salinus]|uniref:hypothetical protein n=1 Tax=Sporohalobacter salinus TaxID=1494606 RepID=UPI00195F3D3B|nr:hypothetical protein [Sporohalobacter salinus]MBM7623653.1 hypothetical protein [Sporohalobacter salinus]
MNEINDNDRKDSSVKTFITQNIYPSNEDGCTTSDQATKDFVKNITGLLTNLETTDKSNLVAAINEIKTIIDSVNGKLTFQGEYADYASLQEAIPDGSGNNGWTAIVTADENNDNSRSYYIYSGSKDKWIFAASYDIVNPATDTVKGAIRLNGDLGGTALNPTVESVAGKSKSEILSSVNKSHTHSNQTILNALGDTNGNLTYQGVEVDSNSEAGANIDDTTASSTTTYSSNKIESLIAGVDKIERYSDKSNFPTTGDNNKLYIAEDTGIVYFWNDSSYQSISSSTVASGNASSVYKQGVKDGDLIQIDLDSGIEVVVTAEKFVADQSDTVTTVNTFDDSDSTDFNYDNDLIEFGADTVQLDKKSNLNMNDKGTSTNGQIWISDMIDISEYQSIDRAVIE